MVKHIKKKTIYAVIISVMLACAALIVFLLLFQVKKIKVDGNKYISNQEVGNWIQKDGFSTNAIYLLAKYNLTDVELLPAMESVEVSLENPWTVSVKVQEKKIVGYIIVDDDFVYFDEEGIVLEKSREWWDDIPYIEGLDVKNVELNKALPVSKENKKVFKSLIEMSEALEKHELKPDKVVCYKSQLYLYFGRKCVVLGSGDFAKKISQIPPILEKLGKKKGTLHLENYDESNTTISFEKNSFPEFEKKKKKEKTDESE